MEAVAGAMRRPGAVLGALVYGLLMWLGATVIASSPLMSGVVFGFFGAIAGLMPGGLVTLRPDQDRYVHATRDAIADGRTTVVVHALTGEEADRASPPIELVDSTGGVPLRFSRSLHDALVRNRCSVTA